MELATSSNRSQSKGVPHREKTAANGRPAAARRTKAANRLLNRELSSIDWSTRVLEQAFDESLPLLERVKYIAFFSSHMDEFFAVRVAGLLDQAASGLNVRSDDGNTPKAMLAEIRRRVEALTARQAALWADDLVPALAAEGIRIGTVDDCDEEELHELDAALPAGDLPGADAARRRAGPAVPVYLGAVAQPRRVRP